MGEARTQGLGGLFGPALRRVAGLPALAPVKKWLWQTRETRRAMEELAAWGYDAARIQRWRSVPQQPLLSPVLAAFECAKLEQQPYFVPGLFRRFWHMEDATGALLRAAESYLHGLRLEHDTLGEWQTAPPTHLGAERAMVRVLNDSVAHAVRFCGGWPDAFAGHGFPSDPPMACMEEIISRCPGRPLDIGAGGIPFFHAFQNRPSWIGSDLGLPALRLMKVALEVSDSHLVCHDAQFLPFPSQSFHLVVSRCVIENVLRPQQMLSEMRRVLCPGGSVVLWIPHGMFQPGRKSYFTNRQDFWNRQEFESACRRAGFDLGEIHEAESVFRLTTPGKLDPSMWEEGLVCPDTGADLIRRDGDRIEFSDGLSYPVVDGIPVLLPQALLYEGIGEV